MYKSEIQNNYFLLSIVLLFGITIFVIRFVNPYLFATLLVVGYIIYHKYTIKIKELGKEEQSFKKWISGFKIKKKDILLSYLTITEHLFKINKLFENDEIFVDSLKTWIKFCSEHNKFIIGNIKISHNFIENMFDLHKDAMNHLLLLRYKLKPQYYNNFDEQINNLYLHSRSLLSEVISNSSYNAEEFDISAFNKWNEGYEKNWKML